MAKIYSNQKFGFFVAIKKEGISNDPRRETWLCRCACGTMKVVRVIALTTGRATSCGCMRKNKAKVREMVPIHKKVLVRRINELAKQSMTTPSKWVEELLEDWIQEHRSNKFTPDPERHSERSGEDDWSFFEDVFHPGDVQEVLL